MSQQYLKGLSWQLGVLLLLLIIGRISTSVAGKVSSGEANANTPSDDYGNDGNDEEEPPLGEQTMQSGPPYFEESVRTINVKPENNTQINCPVKNLGSNNVISWYRDNNDLITVGLNVMKNNYGIDSKMNLIIKHFTNNMLGNYFCLVRPQNVTQQTILKIGGSNETKDDKNQAITGGGGNGAGVVRPENVTQQTIPKIGGSNETKEVKKQETAGGSGSGEGMLLPTLTVVLLASVGLSF